MTTDYKDVVTQALAWAMLVLFIGLFVWGVRVAKAGDPDNELFSYFGTGLATMIAAVVAAEFGQSTRVDGRSILLLVYAIVYFGAGVWGIIVWLQNGNATPVLVRTIATGAFGLALAIVGTYLKPQLRATH